jgi:hypothetical protein
MHRINRWIWILVVVLVVVTAIARDGQASHRSRHRVIRSESGKRHKGERLTARDRRRGGKVAREGRSRGRHGRRAERREAARRHSSRRAERAVASNVPATRTAPAGIPSPRVIEIQTALIKAGYLEGEASGQYDEETQSAMKRFQMDNGVPATGLPSAYSLKKLGVAKGSNDGYEVPVKTVSEHAASRSSRTENEKPRQ